MTKSANGEEGEGRCEVGLGCAPLGNLYRPLSDDDARAIVDAAWDAGVRYFDTAPLYGFGLSERRIGDALRARPRDSFTISTKVGRVLEPDRSAEIAAARAGFVSPMPFTPRYDYSYDGVMRSYEASLQRLGLARIDTVLVHDIGYATHGPDNDRHFGDLESGGYRALDALRAAGDILEIGLGVNEWQACVAAMEIGSFDCFLLAGRYTLLEQEALDRFFPICAAHGASVILGGIYNSGILATGTRQAGAAHYDYAPASVEILEQARCLEQVCEAHGIELAAAALHFALAPPIVRAVIPGIGEERQVRETSRFLSAHIPAAFWQELKSRGLIAVNAPVPAAAR